jgi:opacity protein-like surface antigen
MRSFYTLAIALLAIPAYAQKYEFGVHGGFSMYTEKSVSSPRLTGNAGFKNGFGAGITLGHNMYDFVGGEVRYTYLKNDLKLTSSGTEAKFGAEAHAIHYDLLIHAKSRESRIRPYGAFGGGVKYYRGTGTENAFQPLSGLAILTKTSEIKPMLSVGGGVKIGISDNVLLRLDVHDFLTQVPRDVITPAAGSNLSGWIHNFVPTVGITFTF